MLVNYNKARKLATITFAGVAASGCAGVQDFARITADSTLAPVSVPARVAVDAKETLEVVRNKGEEAAVVAQIIKNVANRKNVSEKELEEAIEEEKKNASKEGFNIKDISLDGVKEKFKSLDDKDLDALKSVVRFKVLEELGDFASDSYASSVLYLENQRDGLLDAIAGGNTALRRALDFWGCQDIEVNNQPVSEYSPELQSYYLATPRAEIKNPAKEQWSLRRDIRRARQGYSARQTGLCDIDEVKNKENFQLRYAWKQVDCEADNIALSSGALTTNEYKRLVGFTKDKVLVGVNGKEITGGAVSVLDITAGLKNLPPAQLCAVDALTKNAQRAFNSSFTEELRNKTKEVLKENASGVPSSLMKKLTQ